MLQLIAMTFVINAWAVPNPGPRSTEQAKFLYQEALDAKKTNKDELAIENYKKIIKQYPSFQEIIPVYEQLMNLQMSHQKFQDVLGLGRDVLLLHPKGRAFAAIQLMRAEAELRTGKPAQTKLIAEELIQSKPEPTFEVQAFLIKAEALSQMNRHKEAFASLDAARASEQFPDAELKIRSRSCSSLQRNAKDNDFDFFNRKNLCFKESAALAKSEPEKASAQVWCDRFALLAAELKKSKIDNFSREKIEKELEQTKGLSSTWGCK